MKIFLSKKDYEDIMDKKKITPEESPDWIIRCIVGNISKEDLDDERTSEINSLDLMQNSALINHADSILEM